jgi:hypothetical protein
MADQSLSLKIGSLIEGGANGPLAVIVLGVIAPAVIGAMIFLRRRGTWER